MAKSIEHIPNVAATPLPMLLFSMVARLRDYQNLHHSIIIALIVKLQLDDGRCIDEINVPAVENHSDCVTSIMRAIGDLHGPACMCG